MRIYVSRDIYVYLHKHLCIHACIHPYIHAHVHIYIYTHIYTKRSRHTGTCHIDTLQHRHGHADVHLQSHTDRQPMGMGIRCSFRSQVSGGPTVPSFIRSWSERWVGWVFTKTPGPSRNQKYQGSVSNSQNRSL